MDITKGEKLDFIKTFITCGSLLTAVVVFLFSVIIGNPKWGFTIDVQIVAPFSAGYFIFILGSILLYIIILYEKRSILVLIIPTIMFSFGFSTILSIFVKLFAGDTSYLFLFLFGAFLMFLTIKLCE